MGKAHVILHRHYQWFRVLSSPSGYPVDRVHGKSRPGVTQFFLFVLITPVFSQSIMKSMYLNQALGQASEAIGRLEDLVSYEKLPVPSSPKPLKDFSIQFNQVSFHYPGTTQKAIDGISFRIPQGKRVALVGASGGGKNHPGPTRSPLLGNLGRPSDGGQYQRERHRPERIDATYIICIPEHEIIQNDPT